MSIIGIHGIKRSGKDTIGNMIADNCKKRLIPCQKLAFADEIRNLAIESQPSLFINKDIITMENLKGEGDIDRDTVDIFELVGIFNERAKRFYSERWIDSFIVKIQRKYGYSITKLIEEYPVFHTIRDVLVVFGTEIGRDIFFHDIWLDIVCRQIESFVGVSVVTDVRFDNEADMIRVMDGNVLIVEKIGLENTSQHRSELGIKKQSMDYIISNEHGKLEKLRKDVDQFMEVINV